MSVEPPPHCHDAAKRAGSRASAKDRVDGAAVLNGLADDHRGFTPVLTAADEGRAWSRPGTDRRCCVGAVEEPVGNRRVPQRADFSVEDFLGRHRTEAAFFSELVRACDVSAQCWP